jgi:hypothetical protein
MSGAPRRRALLLVESNTSGTGCPGLGRGPLHRVLRIEGDGRAVRSVEPGSAGCVESVRSVEPGRSVESVGPAAAVAVAAGAGQR